MEIKDSVGNILNDGDTIVLTKTLKIKWMSKTFKQFIFFFNDHPASAKKTKTCI